MCRRLRAPGVFLLVLLSACAASSSPASAPAPGDRNTLTEAELSSGDFANAYEAVETLRPNWLRTRGVDSFGDHTEVQVYMGNSRLGGVETLRTIELMGIVYIRYFDGLEASARWGLNHGEGAILVSMRPGRGPAPG